jgi:carboxypeptidase Taq
MHPTSADHLHLLAMSATHDLLKHLRESDHLLSAARLLQWDQETYMPSGGEATRAEVLSTLAKFAHERSVSPELADLAARAKTEAASDDEKRQVELVDRDLERARKIPSRLVEETTRATSLAQQTWSRAKKDRDFKTFLPHLETVVALKREEGALLAPAGGTAYDGLLSDYERGMDTADWTRLFDELEAELPDMVSEIVERQESSNARLDGIAGLKGPFPQDAQMEVCRKLAAALGYDFGRGRLDLSAHPFSETVHAGDSRITTRIDETELTGSVYSTLHEAGHALYEQGLPEEFSGTPLGAYCSMSVHESQSRLWENLVGRSDDFWHENWPILRETFPVFAKVDVSDWVAHSRRVARTFVRTESDEATYNLHVLVRFRLEKALIQGDLRVADLPGAWNDAYRRMLGIAPPHDALGCLQDVHWSAGMFGYFPTYTLGNLLSAQLHQAASKAGAASDRPALLAWLRANIHSEARRFETPELIERATGEKPTAKHFLAHLRSRYLER